MSAKRALEKYSQRQLDLQERLSRPRRKNKKPELAVQKEIMAWLKANGFLVNVIEAKAVFCPQAGKFLKGQTDAGVSDIVGCSSDGIATAIEVKAPGRRATLKPHQREFLEKRIMAGAFAACVDSVDCLKQVWAEFSQLQKAEPLLARKALLRHLPAQQDFGDESFFDG